MPNNETKVLDEDGAILLTSNIKTLADATYPANSAVATGYNSSISYTTDDYCLNNGLLYKCNTAIPTGGESWTPAHWDQVNIGTELTYLKTHAIASCVVRADVPQSFTDSEKLQARDNILAEDKKLQFTNVVVFTSAFEADITYNAFPYRAAIPLTGVTTSMYPEVVFNTNEAIEGIYSPVTVSYNGGIYIYASEIPEPDYIIIPNIICWTRGITPESAGTLNIADEIQEIKENALCIDLLWENASPTSSFAAQTIAIDLSNYNYVLIHFRSFNQGDNTQYECNQIILNGTTGGLFASGVTTSNNGTRRVTVTNTGVEFMSGYWNGNANNDYEVPFYIYGIKTLI